MKERIDNSVINLFLNFSYYGKILIRVKLSIILHNDEILLLNR